jgi:putative tryptophan/tyrosine transport system substrate-binding protein
MRRRQFISLLGGAAAASALWPHAARAQQAPHLPTVGILNSTAPDDWAPKIAAFRQGLSDTGYTEGRNVALAFRFAEYHYDRLPSLALDLVRQGVDVILASGGDNSVKAAMAATNTIPIVFTTANDPVTAGYVKSLNSPGGNATGITFLGSLLEPKRLEVLHEIDQKAKSIAVFTGAANARADIDRRAIDAAAKSLGLSVRFVSIGSESDLAPAFREVAARRDDAIHFVTDPFFAARSRTLAALAATVAVPATFSEREFVEAGGLLSYGASVSAAYHEAGTYAGRILKGEKPAELPIQESTKIELIINLKTAKALGLTVPIPLLGRADEVIE